MDPYGRPTASVTLIPDLTHSVHASPVFVEDVLHRYG